MAIGHWLKNYMKWYFDPNCESGEGGGGGSSRILLYENDELDISLSGSAPIIYAAPQNALLLNIPWAEGTALSVEVDGETIITDSIASSSASSASVGLSSPGDTAGISASKNAGVIFNGSAVNSERFIYQVSMIMLNSNVVPAGTHSVKIYKEV